MSGALVANRRPGCLTAIVRAGVVPVALAAGLTSCAPHRVEPPALDLDVRRARFTSALDARVARSAGVEMELSLWVRSPAAQDLPGVQARLLLGGPSAFRLRVASAFGVGLDLAAEGDSLTAYAPRERLGMNVEDGGRSLGVRRPGALGARLWSATWHPPAAAWQRAERSDSLLRLRWNEASDTLELVVGSSGLPASATLRLPSGAKVAARYPTWTFVDGVGWPSRVEVEERNGGWEVSGRIHRVRFIRPPERERLRVRLPATAERVTPKELKRVIERLGRL